jgi:hypothetical protein
MNIPKAAGFQNASRSSKIRLWRANKALPYITWNCVPQTTEVV